MTGIDDRIEEMRGLAERFQPTEGLMNRRVPEAEDIHKLASTLRDVLVWIKERDDRCASLVTAIVMGRLHEIRLRGGHV